MGQAGQLVITDFSRGWDPTHPDEQLVGSFGSPGSQQEAPSGAPFKSPDMHDVDFWNGYLNKRNGKLFLGDPLGAAILGMYSYLYTSPAGTIVRQIVALANNNFKAWGGAVWVSRILTWPNATYAYFESLKNLLFVSSSHVNDLYIPRFWDGTSTALGYHAPRMSPPYLLNYGAGYTAVNISSITGTVVTIGASQLASGIYRGKTIWLINLGMSFTEAATVSSFTTSGTAGTANYFLLTVTLKNPLRYATAGYVIMAWNGSTIVSSAAGGAITIAGALTCIRLLAVTNLKSGGQRASEFSIDVPIGSAGLITLSALVMSFGDGFLFGTDIDNNATTWYQSVPFDPQLTPTDPLSGPSQILYRIPDNKGVATDTSTGFNPMPNSTTTFTVKTNRNANTDTTLIADTAADAQGYFTGQVDVPFYRFAKSWQNFLVLIGDIWNPSSVWISAFGAPQVFGTQGGLDGAYLQIPDGNDGQVIVAAYVWRGVLYIFKTNSVYALEFSGNTSLSPFTVTKLQGNFGPVSPGCVAEGDDFLYFLSPLGVCAISGLTVALLPESESIRSKFVGPNSWNLSLMSNAQCVVFPIKKQIWFQVAVASVGDVVLVYDWQRRVFWYDNRPTPDTALLQDLSSSPTVPYSGDSAGQLFQLDSVGSGETPAIDFYYSTPWLSLGSPGDFKDLKWLQIGGDQQITGTLHVEIYQDWQIKAAPILEFDMTDRLFAVGIWKPLNLHCKWVKIVITNNDQGIPVAIRHLRMLYDNVGPQL